MKAGSPEVAGSLADRRAGSKGVLAPWFPDPWAARLDVGPRGP
jgi:hypothetical protein